MAEAGQQSCEKQKNIISTLLKTPLKKGNIWYLIDSKWFKQWKKYVGFDSWDTSCVGDQTAFPGPIDNGPLFRDDSPGILRDHLMDELDYVLVPEEAWNKLVSWYSVTEGQEGIARKVIEQGMFVKHFKVEVYLMDLKLCSNNDMDKVVMRQFSRADTIDSIEKAMRKLFDITDEREVRLWNKYMSNTYEHLNKPDSTVQDSGLYQGQVIVIEHKNEDGTWPRQVKTSGGSLSYSSSGPSSALNTSSSSTSDSSINASSRSASSSYSNGGYKSSYFNSYDNYKGGGSAPGLCGLSNLGNTCFMNSALQCLSNVPAVTAYFMSEDWKGELNLDNPLGMHGEIATTFAELVRKMWSGECSYTVPRNFKVAVGRFQPQFSGYQQQDSQELMAFLLDGLHEDLNRIKKKPYIERREDDDREDELVAKEAWENYLKRNDSVIVDIFHGLLKSTLVCPTCNKISVTFDPFCYLSLPLPIKKSRLLEVFLVPADPKRKPCQYKLSVLKMGIVFDLCKAMSKVTGLPADKMVVIDVYNHRFHKIFNLDESLSNILDRDDIFIYEVPVTSADDPETVILPVYLREEKRALSGHNYSHLSTQLFGQPLLVAVPRHKCTYSTLYNSVLDKMARYVTVPDDNDEWWKCVKKETEARTNGEVHMQDENSDGEDSNGEQHSESSSPPSSATTSNGDELAGVHRSEATNKPEKPRRLFTFSMVNSCGSAEVDTIEDDGKPIQFSQRSYLAIDWHPKARDIFYNEKEAEDLEVDESMNLQPQQKKQVVQLTECLDLFTTREKLGEQDPWYCPHCKKHQQATKKFDLWNLPQILVIHLKRFSYNRYWRDKLDTFVEYPTRGLNMKKWVISPDQGPATYDLIAVSNHYGGMGGGHYTAYCKNKEDDKWYYFDDSSVSAATEDAVVTKAGYVLIYQRRESTGSQPYSGSTNIGSPERDMIISNGDQSGDEMDTN